MSFVRHSLQLLLFGGYHVPFVAALAFIYTTGTCRLRWLRAGRGFSWSNADDYGTPSHLKGRTVSILFLCINVCLVYVPWVLYMRNNL
jgi:hypothetical protein